MLQMYLLLLCTIIWFVESKGFTVQNVTSPVIKEDLFKAYLYNEVWDTIHFADLTDVASDVSILQLHLEKLSTTCKKFKGCYHERSITSLQNRFSKIRTQFFSLTKVASRQKRGLFNFIGEGLRYLFGSMSASDAEHINNDIDEVYTKNSKVAQLISNQTSLIRTTLVKLQNFASTQKQDIVTLENIVRNGSSQVNINTFNAKLLDSLFETEIHLDSLSETLFDLEQALSSGKTGVVSPRLVTPENFMQSLSVIKNNFYKDLPFPLEVVNYHLYLRISTIDMVVAKNRIIYRIHTPIPNPVLFQVSKFNPIPLSGWTKYYMYENLQDKPVAFTIDKAEYTLIEPDACTHAGLTYYCKITHPIHKFLEDRSCYSHLLKDHTDEACKKKYFNLYSTFIYAFSNGYTWFILPVKPEIITISCPLRSDQTISLYSASLLELDSHCRAYSAQNLYLPSVHNLKTNNTIREHKINFNFTKLEEILLKEPEITLPALHSQHIDLSDIRDNSKTLDELAEQYSELISNRRQRSWFSRGKTAVEYMGYTTILVILLTILWKLGIFKLLNKCFPIFAIYNKCTNCNNTYTHPSAPIYTQTANNPQVIPMVQYHYQDPNMALFK